MTYKDSPYEIRTSDNMYFSTPIGAQFEGMDEKDYLALCESLPEADGEVLEISRRYMGR